MSHLLLPAFYLPPISYLALWLGNHEICIETCENLPKQTYRNRCYIYSANGKLALSIPIKHNGKRAMKEIEISEAMPWKHLHWKSIKIAYQTSAFFEYYEDQLVKIFEINERFLLDFNLKTLEIILKILKTDANYTTTNTFEKTTHLKDYREHFHAKKEDEKPMETYFQNFENKQGFIKNLSIIDLICNKGPESSTYLIKSINDI